ncbi:MAG: helix-turn-helix transcriptional regulator [Bacteroidales bacterium]|nr:helix-turn-helix transcriptional regulator [Bacteroidales bacterium]
MNNRIGKLLKHLGLSAAAFAVKIDVQPSSISHILSGRNKPSADFLEKVVKEFPSINSEWLLTGKGQIGKEPDLFEVIYEESSDEKPASKEVDKIKAEKQIQKKHDADENKTKRSLHIDNQDDNNLIQGKSSAKKNTINNPKIERIVIFYSDKTFREYNPDEI